MNDSQFTVVLPSNASMHLFPNNKISNFVVQLADTLKLHSQQWEVGLSEIQYPHIWFNIRNKRNKLKIVTAKGDVIPIKVPTGYYKNPDEVVTLVNKQLETLNYADDHRTDCKIALIYHKLLNKVVIESCPHYSMKIANTDIGRLLGIVEDVDFNSRVEAQSMALHSNGNFSLYVYMDIVEGQYLGDLKVPLLKVVPVKGKHGDYQCIRYDRPNFIPLSRSEIQNIEVNIRDDTGNLISFEGGKVVLTLVFRRRR